MYYWNFVILLAMVTLDCYVKCGLATKGKEDNHTIFQSQL